MIPDDKTISVSDPILANKDKLIVIMGNEGYGPGKGTIVQQVRLLFMCWELNDRSGLNFIYDRWVRREK